MKKSVLRLSLAILGAGMMTGCATDGDDAGTTQGISAQPSPGSSRLDIQEAQNKAIRRLSY